MNVWVWATSPDNWITVKNEKVWAVNSKNKGKKIMNGDLIAFYVNQTSCFQGIYRVISEWHHPTVDWEDEQFIPILEINLEVVQLGDANMHKLKHNLKFITNKQESHFIHNLRGSSIGPGNGGKAISHDDYQIILNELKLQIKDTDKNIVELSGIEERVSNNSRIPEPSKISIEEIYHHIENGIYGIPDFQRPWVWTNKQLEGLWESIFNSYYIGSILLWESQNKIFNSVPIRGSDIKLENPTMVLDGQQRLSSIYYAIKSHDKGLTDTNRPYALFLNINAYLDSKNESSLIIGYTIKRAKQKKLFDQQIQFQEKIFPLSKLETKNYKDWLYEFRDYLSDVEEIDKEKAKKYYNILDDLFDYVWSKYGIPVVSLPPDLTLEHVVNVFEKINNSGTKLNVFDLLNARFKIHGVVLRELLNKSLECENIKKVNKKYHDKIINHVLQTISLYNTNKVGKRHILQIDNYYLDSDQFQRDKFCKDWADFSNYVDKAILKITSVSNGYGAINFNFIPHTTMIPILACILKKIEKRDDRVKCIKKIDKWYWHSVMNDKYSKSTNETLESDYRDLSLWFDNKNALELSDIPDFTNVKSSSSSYNAIMCLIAKCGAKDFIIDDHPEEFDKLEVHHIFPRSKAKEYSADDKINSVLNKTLLFSNTNKRISNKDPSEYINEIITKQGITSDEMLKRLSTHLISADAFRCMNNDDFPGFIENREKTIRQKFEMLLDN